MKIGISFAAQPRKRNLDFVWLAKVYKGVVMFNYFSVCLLVPGKYVLIYCFIILFANMRTVLSTLSIGIASANSIDLQSTN